MLMPNIAKYCQIFNFFSILILYFTYYIEKIKKIKFFKFIYSFHCYYTKIKKEQIHNFLIIKKFINKKQQ